MQPDVESEMPIDITTEALMSLTDAAKNLPLIDGKRVHSSTLWRWCRKGLRGIRLEHVRLGHRVCTTLEAVSRFTNALAAGDRLVEPSQLPAPPKRTESAERRAITQASSNLAKHGI